MTGNECEFVGGPFTGEKLGDAWPAMPPEWAGTLADRDGPFPLLVKLIFPEDNLSVQVHPGDDYAARHEQAAGGRGKTEMWYVVRAQAGAEVKVGLKAGVTLEKFAQAIAAGAAEECLERIPVRAGDAILVPAGTVHTIGPGVVLCEIQENSDITYRVYDFNRRDAQGHARTLHVEKALAAIQFGKQTGGKIEPLRIGHGAATETYFLACRYFATEKWEFTERIASGTSRGHFELLIFIEGTGRISWGDDHVDYFPAQVWMLPAALGAYQLVPESQTAVLRTYVPKDMKEFARRLTERGIPEAKWSRLVIP
ncbi:MAG: class I mannose-6-phosphate isomerase [Candidatus Acidiferrales bacterium]